MKKSTIVIWMLAIIAGLAAVPIIQGIWIASIFVAQLIVGILFFACLFFIARFLYRRSQVNSPDRRG